MHAHVYYAQRRMRACVEFDRKQAIDGLAPQAQNCGEQRDTTGLHRCVRIFTSSVNNAAAVRVMLESGSFLATADESTMRWQRYFRDLFTWSSYPYRLLTK